MGLEVPNTEEGEHLEGIDEASLQAERERIEAEDAEIDAEAQRIHEEAQAARMAAIRKIQETPEWADLNRLVKSNVRRQEDLAANHGVGMNDLEIAFHRMNMLIELVMPEGTMERIAFEMQFQSLVSQSIGQIEQQVRMRALVGQGNRASRRKSGIIIPGQ